MKPYTISFFFLIVILLFISCGKEINKTDLESELMQGIDLNCDREKIKTIGIVTELAKIKTPINEPLSSAETDKIYKLVEQLKDKEDLVALAKISWAFMKNSSGELECTRSSIIPTFDYAFWHCIKILAEDRSEDNLQRMRLLKDELNVSNADGYNWSTIVDRIPMP
jgi:hypothetical protein